MRYSMCTSLPFLAILFATFAKGQGLGAATPAKEYIRFDGQTVATENATAGPASAGVYDDADPRIQYSGSWFHYPPAGQSTVLNGTQSAAFQTGAYASFTFTGTTVSYLYSLSSGAGIANVYIDDALVASIDQYSPQDNYHPGYSFTQKIFTAPGLANTSHTIKITESGQQNSASSGSNINLDGFIAGPIYNDNDSTFTYTGSWSDSSGLTAAWSGDEHITSTVGDSASFSFTGSFITVLYSESGTAGALVVSVDGKRIDTIDENYPAAGNPPDYFLISRTYTGLSSGAHTLTLTCAASPSAPNATTVTVDAAIAPQ